MQANGVVGELATGQSCPPDGLLAFLDVLLRRATLIVEDDEPLGGTGEVGYNEADPWIKFARMPFDLGDDAASGAMIRLQCERLPNAANPTESKFSRERNTTDPPPPSPAALTAT